MSQCMCSLCLEVLGIVLHSKIKILLAEIFCINFIVFESILKFFRFIICLKHRISLMIMMMW